MYKLFRSILPSKTRFHGNYTRDDMSDENVHFIKHIQTEGCLGINKLSGKLELTHCDISLGLLVLNANLGNGGQKCAQMLAQHLCLSRNIMTELQELPMLSEGDLNSIRDSMVNLVIHASAVFATFVIFFVFYCIHTSSRIFQDDMNLG